MGTILDRNDFFETGTGYVGPNEKGKWTVKGNPSIAGNVLRVLYIQENVLRVRASE